MVILKTEAFVKEVRNGTVNLYEESGHLPHFEESDRFAKDVIEFVLMHRGRSSITGQEK
jgi:proline iminopeptidase